VIWSGLIVRVTSSWSRVVHMSMNLWDHRWTSTYTATWTFDGLIVIAKILQECLTFYGWKKQVCELGSFHSKVHFPWCAYLLRLTRQMVCIIKCFTTQYSTDLSIQVSYLYLGCSSMSSAVSRVYRAIFVRNWWVTKSRFSRVSTVVVIAVIYMTLCRGIKITRREAEIIVVCFAGVKANTAQWGVACACRWTLTCDRGIDSSVRPSHNSVR